MEYYNDDDYARVSPKLAPFQPDPGSYSPLPFAPLWLPEDTYEAPLDSIHIERAGNGLEARRKLHKRFRNEVSQGEWEFMDTLLLHQMAPTNPQLTLSLGLGAPLETSSETESWPNDEDFEASSPIPPPQAFTPPPPARSRRPKKTRLGLPITLHKQGVLATVLACADTGADVNIISDEVAKTLGYSDYDTLPEKKELALANGKLVEAVGRIESVCSFGIETESLATMTCAFYVLLTAATPIIMGLSFLEQTKTMTAHRERLVRVPTPAFQALSVCSVDKPRQLLACELDRRETLATPDSGSEIDLISPAFAAERGLTIYPGEEAIQLADGSIAITTGYCHVEIAVASINMSDPANRQKSNITVDLFLLDNLNHDLIVSEDSLDELKVFTDHQGALIPAPLDSRPLGINRIRHLGAIDSIVSWIKKKIRIASSSNQNDTNLAPSFVSQATDQRENDRREREADRIAKLPVDEQQAAIEAEVIKQEAYERRPRHMAIDGAFATRVLPPPLNPDPISAVGSGAWGAFTCLHSGCNAAPFQTQYLLNAHMNGHASSRPYFCSIAGCPRSEGGRGFKRVNEMIRHGLIHQSPGYVCPFCPDREHKYPRPDNLQRHVRVHHTDKDKDDPLLRDVLAQRPQGGSHGNRSRIRS